MSKSKIQSDKKIDELIESYKGQNEALEKILEKINKPEDQDTVFKEENIPEK